MAYVEIDSGNPDRALPLLHESLALSLKLEDPFAVIVSRLAIANAMTSGGHPEDANDLLCSLIDEILRFGDVSLVAAALHEFAQVAAQRGFDRRAALLAGAAERFDEESEMVTAAADIQIFERVLTPARQRMGLEEWEAAFATGTQLTQDQAVALATEHVEQRTD